MINLLFETDRPIFFIHDKYSNEMPDLDISKSIYKTTPTNIALLCSIITDDMENSINIYVDEEYENSSEMDFLIEKRLTLSSNVILIDDSDLEKIFEKDLGVSEILLKIYVNKDYYITPEVFDIVISTKI